jgi:hypothetical protein
MLFVLRWIARQRHVHSMATRSMTQAIAVMCTAVLSSALGAGPSDVRFQDEWLRAWSMRVWAQVRAWAQTAGSLVEVDNADAPS